jgi:Collagen triple helix repeat (20 copies)
MFSSIRKRLTYANVAMTLALVFAMTGGAYAAKHYLITSTKQISPKVLTALKGKTGPAGKDGAQGPAGPAGLAGSKGENGAAGLEGKEGKEGKAGVSVTSKALAEGDKNCAAGGSEFKAGASTTYACNGSPWPAGGTLPKGATETGSWALQGTAKGEEFKFTAISFPIPLKASPTSHFFKLGETVTAPCKGNVEKPEAEPGALCVFEGEDAIIHKGGIIFQIFDSPGPNAGVSVVGTTGVDLVFATPSPTASGEVTAEGTWAVTG